MSGYNDYTDQELAALLTQGNRLAFTEIYDRYKGVLFVHALRRLNNQEEAEDIIHDLFTTIWNRRNELSVHTQLRAYLYTAVRNRILKMISRKKIESAYIATIDPNLSDTHLTDNKLRETELARIIEKEIATLPSKMREIFLLSRQEHMSHKEIADRLHISEQTVAKQVTNALKILRKRLGLVLYLIYLINSR